MMKCKEVRTRLIDYYEGELDNTEQSVMEDHLKDCKMCLSELDEFIHTLEILFQSFSIPEVPDVFWAQFTRDLMEKVRKEKEKTLVPSRWFSPTHFHFSFATAAWAALLILAVGFVGYSGYRYVVNQNRSQSVVLMEDPVVQSEIKTLVKMIQDDPQSDEHLLKDLVGAIALDETESKLSYDLAVVEANAVFDAPEVRDVEGIDADIESLLKSLNEKETEALLSKLRNMI
jgi:hypothetical protein